MQRETKTFTTATGRQIVIYTYVTAREANAIKEAMYKAMKIDMTSGQPVASDLTGEFMLLQEQKLMGALVVSVDGNDKDVPSQLLDMRNEDYQSIVAEANKVYAGNFPQAK